MTTPVPPAVPQPDPRPVPGPSAGAPPMPGPPAPRSVGESEAAAASGSATGPEDAATSGALSPVAAALARLDGVHTLALHEQPDVYQRVHAELQNALATIDHA